MERRIWAGAIVGLLVAVPGCNLIDFDDLLGDEPPRPAWTDKTDFEPAPSGPLFAAHTVTTVDILYTPAPRRPPEQALDRLLAEADQPFTKVGELPEGGQRPSVAAAFVDRAPLWKDKPERLDRHSFGLGEARRKALRAPGKQLQLRFGLPGRGPLHLNRRALAMAEQIALRTGGVLWDPVTREAYSVERWKKRLAAWTGDFPPLSGWLNSDWYYTGGLVRIVTAGMSRFGLPDLQIDRIPQHLASRVELLLKLACQAMLQTGKLGPGGILTLQVNALADGYLTEAHERRRAPNATLDLRIQLEKVDGHPSGFYQRLLAVSVRGHETHQESLIALLRRVYGQDEDSWFSFKLTDEIKAASKKARKHLLEVIKPRWQAGRFDLGERLEVKVRFEDRNGHGNHLWVQVVDWRGRLISGVLKDDAKDIEGMQAGTTVEIIDEWVFDYRHIQPDGTESGNETAALIKKASQPQAPGANGNGKGGPAK